jgi:pyruvate ferredoxin oxidoreductase gamma subunit/2-oxoisovalerate ferredoxin oxidoreductase gamma subunit
MTETEETNDIISIIMLGRGGQGAVTACEIIAEAAYMSGNFLDVHAYPSFGAERRGAPVQAYAKLSHSHKIWDRAQIEHPDILIVFDESVLDPEVALSLKPDGTFIINSNKEPKEFLDKFQIKPQVKIIVADISNLALEKGLTIDGNPVINTPILGLLSKALPELTLENLRKVVIEKLGEKIGLLNYELIEKGYKMAKIL